jgi:hypothetical protein
VDPGSCFHSFPISISVIAESKSKFSSFHRPIFHLLFGTGASGPQSGGHPWRNIREKQRASDGNRLEFNGDYRAWEHLLRLHE